MIEKAMKKMLKELDVPEYNPVMERIHVYLCNTDDEQMIAAVLQKDRTILNASMYCYKQGAAMAIKNGSIGVADVTPEMEIDWIKEYYLKDSISNDDLRSWPSPGHGQSATKEIIKEVEVVKEVFVGTPSMEHIQKYLAEQKKLSKGAKKSSVSNEEKLSIFD